MPSVFVLVPGSLETRTGGYAYDRRITAGLRARGWSVLVRELEDSFPRPTEAARAHAARVLATIPDDSTVLIDGLALGVMPAELERERSRLRLVALIHHPLADETGLDPDVAATFRTSERRALATVRMVIVTGPGTASTLHRYGVPLHRLAVVEPGTDPRPLATRSRGGYVQLLCVATLTPRKGHEILFEALASIPTRRWRLACVGSHHRHEETARRLSAWVRDHRLETCIELTGEADERTLERHYSCADVFVLATLYEGYGMAVAEAIAYGLPVVSTKTGAIADLVARDAGVVVPPGDVAALSGALQQVVEDDRFRARLAEGARRARARLTTWESAASKLAAVLDQVAIDAYV